jgi:hypothetical protein
MRELWFERTTSAQLMEGFRVESQVPSTRPLEAATDRTVRLPLWLYDEPRHTSAFSRYDLRKSTEGAAL